QYALWLSLVFSSAEGSGIQTTRGSGGVVFYMTTLNACGPGSLLADIEKERLRIIVFSVSGNIAIESDLLIGHGDLTVAGQSAPGDGITIRDYPVNVGAGNVIIRYLRFRLGEQYGLQDDTIGGRDSRKVIIEQCYL